MELCDNMMSYLPHQIDLAKNLWQHPLLGLTKNIHYRTKRYTQKFIS